MSSGLVLALSICGSESVIEKSRLPSFIGHSFGLCSRVGWFGGGIGGSVSFSLSDSMLSTSPPVLSGTHSC